MNHQHLLFQYCPKLVVIDGTSVLLCRRAGEADLDGIYSFIGGKMEHGDESIIAALHREKTEEVGSSVKLRLLASYSLNAEFTKADGNRMILPHFLAHYVGGPIELNEEYSEFQWVELDKLSDFGPKIDNIPEICAELQRLQMIARDSDFTMI